MRLVLRSRLSDVRAVLARSSKGSAVSCSQTTRSSDVSAVHAASASTDASVSCLQPDRFTDARAVHVDPDPVRESREQERRAAGRPDRVRGRRIRERAELVEIAAARQAVARQEIEARPVVDGALDCLVTPSSSLAPKVLSLHDG